MLNCRSDILGQRFGVNGGSDDVMIFLREHKATMNGCRLTWAMAAAAKGMARKMEERMFGLGHDGLVLDELYMGEDGLFA